MKFYIDYLLCWTIYNIYIMAAQNSICVPRALSLQGLAVRGTETFVTNNYWARAYMSIRGVCGW